MNEEVDWVDEEMTPWEYIWGNVQDSLTFWREPDIHFWLKCGWTGNSNIGHNEIKEELEFFRRTAEVRKSWSGYDGGE